MTAKKKAAKKKATKKKTATATGTEGARNILCPECGENIVDGEPCTDCAYDPSKPPLAMERTVQPGLEEQRYRLTLRKALKRVSAQVSNMLIAHESEILEEMDENKPIKIKIPIMVNMEWDGENMTLNHDLTVKRVPLKWAHGDETVNVDAMLPGMEDLEWGE